MMHQDNPGPSNIASQPEERTSDAVLGEVLVNQSALRQVTAHGQPTEDQDLALAKMLQEQERAFTTFGSGHSVGPGPAENVPPPVLGSRASSGSPDAERPLTDEELAWRLMQEEETQFQQRMMALAGLAPGDNDEDMGSDNEDDEGIDPDTLSYEELTALGEVVGTVATGLTSEQLAALPRSTFAAMKAAQPVSPLQQHQQHQCINGSHSKALAVPVVAEAEEQCAVCRIEYAGEDEVTVLPCQHFYHPECIAQWLQQKKVCPQCNKEVVEDAKCKA